MKNSWLPIVLSAVSVFLAGANSATADDRDRHDRDHRSYRSDWRAGRQREREQRWRLERDRRRRAELRRHRHDRDRHRSGRPFDYIRAADAERHRGHDGPRR